MQLKRVEITELQGINRNAVEGVTQQQPTVLKAVDFDNAGGYRAFRGGDIFLSGSYPGVVVGSDEGGLFAFGSYSNSNYVVTLYDGTSASTTSGSAAPFFPPVGFVSSSEYYFFDGVGVIATLTRDFTGGNDYYPVVSIVTDSGSINATDLEADYSFTSAVESTSSYSTLDVGDYRVYLTRVINTKRGQLYTTGGDVASVSVLSSGAQIDVTYSYGSTSLPDDTQVLVHLQPLGGVAIPELPSFPGFPGFSGTILNSEDPDTAISVLAGVGTDESGSISILSQVGEADFAGPPTLMQFQGKAVHHNRRFYGQLLNTSDAFIYTSEIGASGRDSRPLSTQARRLPNTIAYSKIGTLNAWQNASYFQVPFVVSSEITGLKSTPAGLLIFGDTETFLMRSDPALNDFGLQRVSGVIGCDSGIDPVAIGGVVFVVYQGEIYSISLGMGDVDFGSGITKISAPVFEPSNPFNAISVEAKYRQLVAKYTDNTLVRFDFETQQWLSDVISSSFGATNLFSHPGSSGTRYYNGTSIYSAYRPQDTPVITWSNVDLGDKDLMKQWRRVRIHMNDSYSGTPFLNYVINNTSGTLTGVNETGNRFTFTFPSGLVNEKIEELTLNLIGAVEGDTLEPPVVIEFSERYRRR